MYGGSDGVGGMSNFDPNNMSDEQKEKFAEMFKQYQSQQQQPPNGPKVEEVD